MGRADEYLKLDAVGVLATDEKGAIKEQKLGRRAGKRGLGIGVALSVIAGDAPARPVPAEKLRRMQPEARWSAGSFDRD